MLPAIRHTGRMPHQVDRAAFRLPDDYSLPVEDVDFCLRIVAAVPSMVPLWEQHLDEEFGEPLPYIFLLQLARWAEEHAVARRRDVVALLRVLNRGLDRGRGDVPSLVLAGFVESMSTGSDLIPLVRGSLRPWVEYEFGVREVVPVLRRRWWQKGDV